jgi:flagellar biosynthesis chaperone FliJ
MTESTTEATVSIDDLRDALANAEAQTADLRAQQRELEAELRGLLNTGLSDQQYDAERQRIKGEHRALVEQEQTLNRWSNPLGGMLDLYERNIARPCAELCQAEQALSAIDEKIEALTQQLREAQGEREALLLRRDACQAAVEAIAIEMPEQPAHPLPARVVSQVGTRTRYLDASGNEVNPDGSPILNGNE